MFAFLREVGGGEVIPVLSQPTMLTAEPSIDGTGRRLSIRHHRVLTQTSSIIAARFSFVVGEQVLDGR